MGGIQVPNTEFELYRYIDGMYGMFLIYYRGKRIGHIAKATELTVSIGLEKLDFDDPSWGSIGAALEYAKTILKEGKH
jgi:hypothetical protein